MLAPRAPWIRQQDGITTIDAEYVRPGLASVHVLAREGRAMLIDSGANSSVPLVMRALNELEIAPDRVDWLFLTHVHLDHAGGAGALLKQLPSARVAIHPRGASHLVDPTRLESATAAVYGRDAFERLYGTLIPIPAERLHQTGDGERVCLGSSELIILHTPGHAMHHQVLFDPEARAVFTGDTFGLAYPELETPAGAFIVPTTTPTQFDPDQLLASVQRIADLRPDSLYLTHFGRVSHVPRLAQVLREQIEQLVALAREHAAAPDRHEQLRTALRDYWVARAQAHGIPDAQSTVSAVLGADLELNTQGLIAWLERQAKPPRGSA